MGHRVVCISQVAGAGGVEIGQRVAKRLAFRYIDNEVINLAAEHAGIDPAVLRDAEHYKSLVARVMDVLFAPPDQARHSTLGRAEKPAAGFTTDEARHLIQDTIVEIADRGSVVIVAHAASMALAKRPDVLRVHVTASLETRVRRLWLPSRLPSDAEHRRSIEESDHQRRKYLERFYGIHEELPTHYDLVINTDLLDYDPSVAVIAAAATA